MAKTKESRDLDPQSREQSKTERRPYEAPRLESEPLFESVAAATGKDTLLQFDCDTDDGS